MPLNSTLSRPVLEDLQSLLQLRMSAVSADIYAKGAKPSPNVIQIAQWRAKRSELALEADGFVVLFAIERARAGVWTLAGIRVYVMASTRIRFAVAVRQRLEKFRAEQLRDWGGVFA